MRVISGFLRGRIIKGDKIEGTRPTMDSIKESLFAIIQNDVKNAICLDLFAGSGSLGIEAISNGASYTYFVDKNRIAINTINDNIKTFKIDDYTKVILDDYMKALQSFKRQNLKFNLIFLDPPYKNHFIDGILKFVSENNLLYENGQVICELNDEILQEQYNELEVKKEKNYGDKKVIIYINKKDSI